METKSKPVHILFVDDEDSAIVLFNHSLRKEIESGQYIVHAFNNGLECLNFLKENDVDILIMFTDIRMPGMDGFTLLDQVKVLHPCLDVFFISSYDLDEYKNKATSKGAKGFLTKPINFNAVKTIIDDYRKTTA